jgi:hypothetical protein
MRTSYYDIKLLTEEDADKPWGIAIPAAGCAEHEGGIGMLEHWLRIGTRSEVGVERRQMNDVPSGVAYFWSNDVEVAFVVGDRYGLERLIESSGPTVQADNVIVFQGKIPPTVDLHVRGMDRPTVRGEDGRTRLKPMPKRKEDRRAMAESQAGFQAAWDSKDFMIFARGAAQVQVVTDIAEAYRANELVVSLGKAMPFSAGGLN